MLVKRIVMKAGLLLPICIFCPHFCHALSLPQYLGARASSVSATHVSIIHHIHHSVEESTDSGAGRLWGQIDYQPAHIWRKTLSCTHTQIMWEDIAFPQLCCFSHAAHSSSLCWIHCWFGIYSTLSDLCKNTILTFYSGKWSLLLIPYIAYTLKLVILRYSI